MGWFLPLTDYPLGRAPPASHTHRKVKSIAMATASDKITKAIQNGITANLKLTGGAMPIAMLLPDIATAKFAADQAKGRKGCKLLTFTVSPDSKYKSVGNAA